MISLQCAHIVVVHGGNLMGLSPEKGRCVRTGKLQQIAPFYSGDGSVMWRGVDGHAGYFQPKRDAGVVRMVAPEIASAKSPAGFESCRHITESSIAGLHPTARAYSGLRGTKRLLGHRLTARRNYAHDEPRGWLDLDARG